MNLLFVYNSKFKQDNKGNLYTDSSINEKMWKRYTGIAKNVTIISRLEPHIFDMEIAKEKFNRFIKKNKTFIAIPDLTSSIKNYFNRTLRRESRDIIKRNVLTSDVIIARLPSQAGYIAVKYAKRYKKPYLVEVVGCPRDSFWHHSLKGKVLAVPNYIKMKKSVKSAPYAIYVTDEFLQRRYPNKGESVGCSDVVLSITNEDILKKRITKIKNMKKKSTIILGTAAAIDVKYKGQQYVIQAIAKLKEEGYLFEYYLAGGGQENFLRKIAKKYGVSDQVKFLGTLPHEQIFDYFSSIDVYIQPSNLEGLPRSLIEAMSVGCPALGSNVGGIPELLSSKAIFKSGSVREITNLLKNIDKDFLIEQAEKNYERSKDFNTEHLEDIRRKFYNEFINNYKRNS